MSKRWNYLVIEAKTSLMGSFKTDVLQEELDRHGRAGWELVNSVNNGAMYPLILLFKREN